METNVNPRRGIDESRAIIRVVGVELIFTTASIKRPTRAARKRPGRRRRRDVANDSSISISMIYAPAKLRTVVSANAKKYDPPGNHRARPRDISSPPVRYIGPSLSFFSFLSLSLSLSFSPSPRLPGDPRDALLRGSRRGSPTVLRSSGRPLHYFRHNRIRSRFIGPPLNRYIESAPGITRQMSFTDGNLFIRKICQLCENSIEERSLSGTRNGESKGEKVKASISGETCRKERKAERRHVSAETRGCAFLVDAPDGAMVPMRAPSFVQANVQTVYECRF
jgi:hypothetical protein